MRSAPRGSGHEEEPVHEVRPIAALGLALGLAAACAPEKPPVAAPPPAQQPGTGEVVARFGQGTLTREELLREATRMPPALRQKFTDKGGREELARSLVDKKLLVLEADRRSFGD